jgi:hypothetical protein
MLGCTAALAALLLPPLLLLPAGPGCGVNRATSFARASSTCRHARDNQLKYGMIWSMMCVDSSFAATLC